MWERIREAARVLTRAKPDKAMLAEDRSGPTTTGVRAAYDGMHPAQGLTPQRLARILREAIDGDPTAYLALAEDMEERDPHYAGVLGIRKRQVSAIPITVEAASDATADVAAADLVREVIARDVFRLELIDVLDAVGKGYSVTEIIWDTSGKRWLPAALKWRDPRWFQFDPLDLETLYRRGPAGPEPLEPAKYIIHMAKAKSGLPIRGGIARLVAWTFLFKSFDLKDWAVFCEAYGQPLRIGKYGQAASDADKETLLRAIRAIGSDFGAIIPDSMVVEFVQATLSGSLDLYERRANWLDQQTSKAVLGQTQTTDATAGGYATAKVHDGVRGDIEQADADQLAATLNRDLVRPVIDLNLGPPKGGRYPRLIIRRPEAEDLTALASNLEKLVPLGLQVSESWVRDKFGVPDPDAGEDLLAPRAAPPTAPADPAAPPAPADPSGKAAMSQLFTAPSPRDAVDEAVAAILADEGWERMVAPMLTGLEARLETVTSEAELAQVLADHLAGMDVATLAETLARARFAARISGETREPL
ncbi:MAG: DUF935 domain-containing protein [Hyphomicrobiaceae bacterium]|nr:DUF935 domain-containing protein [Hyphomicrobiaceae bacterium]